MVLELLFLWGAITQQNRSTRKHKYLSVHIRSIQKTTLNSLNPHKKERPKWNRSQMRSRLNKREKSSSKTQPEKPFLRKRSGENQKYWKKSFVSTSASFSTNTTLTREGLWTWSSLVNFWRRTWVPTWPTSRWRTTSRSPILLGTRKSTRKSWLPCTEPSWSTEWISSLFYFYIYILTKNQPSIP